MSAALLDSARDDAAASNLSAAETKYLQIIQLPANDDENTSKLVQNQESAILELGKIYQTEKHGEKISELIEQLKSVLGNFAKSKTAKIIKTLIEYIDEIPDSLDLSIKVTENCINWAVESKLTFLRQSLQLKLASLLHEKTQYQQGLKIITELLREYKKLDDKSSLVEVQLLESQIYHALRNIPKSRAALTSARTSANLIYCPTLLQAELDCQLGILNAEDKDYKTAFSYFLNLLRALTVKMIQEQL